MIVTNICLSDIPAEKRIKGSDGKIYCNIVITEMKQADKFENTHTAYMAQTKEEREVKTDRIYVGKGKEYIFTEQKPAEPAKPTQPDLPVSSEKDDLPF